MRGSSKSKLRQHSLCHKMAVIRTLRAYVWWLVGCISCWNVLKYVTLTQTFLRYLPCHLHTAAVTATVKIVSFVTQKRGWLGRNGQERTLQGWFFFGNPRMTWWSWTGNPNHPKAETTFDQGKGNGKGNGKGKLGAPALSKVSGATWLHSWRGSCLNV